MKVLVSGTCGFIGSNLIRKAIYDQKDKKPQEKHTFVSIDRVTDNAINSMYWNNNHTFYPADITDQHIIDVIFQREQPDIVIHLAAETHVDTSLKDPNSFVMSNVLGTQVLINASLKYKVKKFVFANTDEVYGQLNPSDLAWKEDAPLNPRNPYSASKAAAELMVKAAHETHGLTYNITRSSNVYGPRQLPDKLIPKAIKCLLEGKNIPIYGQGLQIRDWTYVADHCSALMTIMEKGAPNEAYNISTNHELTNIHTIEAVCDAMGHDYSLIKLIDDPRPGHDFRYSVDTTKIKQLGWKPSYKFKDGLAATIEWYQLNKWFIK